MEDFLDLYLARIIKIILLFLNVQDLNHTDYFQSEQDDLISNNRNTKCLLNKKLQQKDTQAAVQTRETWENAFCKFRRTQFYLNL